MGLCGYTRCGAAMGLCEGPGSGPRPEISEISSEGSRRFGHGKPRKGGEINDPKAESRLDAGIRVSRRIYSFEQCGHCPAAMINSFDLSGRPKRESIRMSSSRIISLYSFGVLTLTATPVSKTIPSIKTGYLPVCGEYLYTR